jgi:hypothetical protein
VESSIGSALDIGIGVGAVILEFMARYNHWKEHEMSKKEDICWDKERSSFYT